ncbi:MAG: hypothetical protein ACD_28C00033G0002 [uncultured bacterium]|nr:MAG: hypothetical protein ACD_28C00033G0002 [uncultured bacterium]KKT74913.1 MAG: hypothetical protein UW70_C0043G0006 [Candidatus Peregrinibacteria bacterium GW2011_GWA2_44_7]
MEFERRLFPQQRALNQLSFLRRPVFEGKPIQIFLKTSLDSSTLDLDHCIEVIGAAVQTVLTKDARLRFADPDEMVVSSPVFEQDLRSFLVHHFLTSDFSLLERDWQASFDFLIPPAQERFIRFASGQTHSRVLDVTSEMIPFVYRTVVSEKSAFRPQLQTRFEGNMVFYLGTPPQVRYATPSFTFPIGEEYSRSGLERAHFVATFIDATGNPIQVDDEREKIAYLSALHRVGDVSRGVFEFCHRFPQIEAVRILDRHYESFQKDSDAVELFA